MTSDTDVLSGKRWIPLVRAVDLIGERFHANWSASDSAMLEYDEVDAPDKEAWHRAKHVEEALHRLIAGGPVTAYARTDDGTGMTDLPIHWVTDPVFTLCLRTGRFRQTTDQWEPLWIDHPNLIAALPPKGSPRKKRKFEWDKIVHEAWMFALRSDSIPTKAQVERHLGGWSSQKGADVPDSSHLFEVAKVVVDFLNENKTRRQNLKSEKCEAGDELKG